MNEKEYLTSRTYCYECKKPFALTSDHAKNYDSSGLCPKCFDKVLEEAGRDAVMRGAIEKLLRIATELGNVISILKKGE